jgi:hypothetical protein
MHVAWGSWPLLDDEVIGENVALTEYPWIVEELRKWSDDPQLDQFTDEVFSLFHRQSISSFPWVNERIVFAWLEGDQLLIVDDGGAASLGTVGGQRWENGWFDLAMLNALRLPGHTLITAAVEWVRIENETRSELLLLDDVGKAATPEEGGRVLARVAPGETVVRPVLRSRPPWLIAGLNGRFRLDMAHDRTTATMSGIRFSTHEARLGGDLQRRSGFVVKVEATEVDGTRLGITGILVVIAAAVAWAWARTRRLRNCGKAKR